MKHRDLGVLDGDVLLFGGAYSNLQATWALMGQAHARAIAADHVICTGDIVAYCGAPARTASTNGAVRRCSPLLRRACAHCVAGARLWLCGTGG